MQAGRKKKAISKVPRFVRIKNRLFFQDRVLGTDWKGNPIAAKAVRKYARPLEARREEHRLKQEAREEARDPTYVPVEPIVTITTTESSVSSEE